MKILLPCLSFLAVALCLFYWGHPVAGGWCIGLAFFTLVDFR